MQIDDSLIFPPEPAPIRRRSATTRPRTDRLDRGVIVAVSCLSAIGGVLAGGQPTGSAVADVCLCGAFAGLVTLAGSRSRRSTWVWAAGVATVAAPSLALAAVGLAAMAVAVLAQVLDRRKRTEGAVVLALSVQVLLRLGDVGVFGGSALLVALAVTPVLVSAYRVAPRRVKRRVHVGGWIVFGVVLVGLTCFFVSTALAASRLDAGVLDARAGLEAARSAHDSDAQERLSRASDAFGDANGLLDAWWARPARVLPIVGHQAEVSVVATAEGERLAALAADAAQTVPIEDLRFESGRLDLDLVRAAQGPLLETSEALVAAERRLSEVDTGWVVPPFSNRLDDLQDAVAEASPDAAFASDVAQVAPALLGGDGARHYFVIFTTPAESRGLGGFMGNWAELTAEDGKLTLTRSGRTQELRDATPASARSLSVMVDGESDQRMVDYLDRYGVQRPWDAIQDVTVSPDFPTVAEAMRQIYPQAGGTELDGVLVVDPFALAALMRFTGPIRLDGVERPLTTDNAAQYLLVDQYRLNDQTDREDALDEAGRKVFEALTTGDLPNPRAVAERLAPVVREGRLGLVSFHPDEQDLFEEIGVDDAMPGPGPVDGFSLVTTNGGQNKIDTYLHRTVRYDTTVDPATGALDASASIELSNEVPSLDLPTAVVGNNDQGFPLGTNEALVSFYTPHLLRSGTIDGERVGFASHRERGWWVFSTRVVIPPGGTVELELELEGQVAPFDRYELLYVPQPLVTVDEVVMNLDVGSGWQTGESDGFTEAGDGRAQGEPPDPGDVNLWVDVLQP